MIQIIGVRFRKSGKVYYFDPAGFEIQKGDHVIVETVRGVEYGLVVLAPKEVEDDKVIKPLKSVMRVATPEDARINEANEIEEKEAFNICLEKIRKHELEMKLIDSEYTFDKNKLLFYFTADGRIDFRELVKDLASVFRTRIELRQIGVRDETKMIGGIGICGRPLCCHTFLSDFAPVSIKMAKEQNLSLNPAKISGMCGRLMCCLKNEEDAYEYLNSTLPHIGANVVTFDGYEGEVQSVSVLKQKVKVLICNENDEKEVREYHASELQYESKNRPADARISQSLPDEEIDETAIRELEQMEMRDLEEAEEAEDTLHKKQDNRHNNRRRPNYHHNNNHNDNSQSGQRPSQHHNHNASGKEEDSSSGESKRHSGKTRYKNNNSRRGNGNHSRRK